MVKELVGPKRKMPPKSFKVNLNEEGCECRQFLSATIPMSIHYIVHASIAQNMLILTIDLILYS